MTWTTQQLPSDHPPVKSGNIGKGAFINKGDYQYYLELKKSGNSWQLSIPCDMETLEISLEQSGNVLKNDSEGLSLEFDGKNINVIGDRTSACQTIAKSYTFVPDCKISENVPEAGFFRGDYKAVDDKGEEFIVNFSPYGMTSGWKNYTAYDFSDITNDNAILFRNPDDDNILIVAVEIKDEKIIFYECIRCDDNFELGADLNKAKKLLTLTRK